MRATGGQAYAARGLAPALILEAPVDSTERTEPDEQELVLPRMHDVVVIGHGMFRPWDLWPTPAKMEQPRRAKNL